MSEATTLLVASLSARALTRSARRGGFRVLAIDGFGDADTYQAAAKVRTIPCDAGGFQAEVLLGEIGKLVHGELLAGLVYGSGFEERPELLDRLAETCRLYGNSPETVSRVKEPSHWSAALDALGLHYPETMLQPPSKTDGWLAKRQGGSGGWHVCSAAAAPCGAGWFYQRRIEGPVYSVLFLADGYRDARIIGFNRQWNYGEMGGYGFGYAGAISKPKLSRSVRDELSGAAARLTAMFKLRGLNGIDFVLDRTSRPYFLELNPRPTATLELWDDDWAEGLVAAHIRACSGELPDRCPESAWVRGHVVVYAQSALLVPDGLALPEWCRDIPHGGSVVHAGQPFCSVFVEGKNAEAVQALAWFRRDLIQRSMGSASVSEREYRGAARVAAAIS